MSDRLLAEAANWTKHNKHKRRTSIPSAVFEPASPEIKRLQTYLLDRTVTVIGLSYHQNNLNNKSTKFCLHMQLRSVMLNLPYLSVSRGNSCVTIENKY